MDPLSLLVGFVAGALFIACAMPWLLYPPARDDGSVERLIAEMENAPQFNGGLIFSRRSKVIDHAPDERTFH